MGNLATWGDVAGAAAGTAATVYGAGLAAGAAADLAQLALGPRSDRSAQWNSGWQRTLQQRGQLQQPQPPQEKPQP